VLAATHGPPANQKAGGSYHRFSQIIRHSLRDGFNAYSALSLGTGLSCSHRPRDHHPAGLASASGGQDHTPLRPLQCRSSARMNRARRQSVHRIPRSTCRDDRPKRPSSSEAGCADHASDLGSASSLFLKIGIQNLRHNGTTGSLRRAQASTARRAITRGSRARSCRWHRPKSAARRHGRRQRRPGGPRRRGRRVQNR
jgi:hypothetical protein